MVLDVLSARNDIVDCNELHSGSVIAFRRTEPNYPAVKHSISRLPCHSCSARKRAICSVLDGDKLDDFSKAGQIRLVKAGQSVYAERDEAEHFFTIISGDVRLSNLLEDGRRQIVSFRGSGDKIGDYSDGQFATDAEAISDTIVCQFPRQEMEKKLEKQQALSSQLITIMRREIDELRDHTLSLGRKTPVEKVATFLINRYQKLELSGTTDVTISLPMSRSDIADYLGLTIETVSRTISRLRNDGILLVPSVQSVVVKDMTGLSRLAALNS